jgi:hypothetical protein
MNVLSKPDIYDKESFIAEARKVHGDRYCYDGSVFLGYEEITFVKCYTHLELILISPYEHVEKRIRGCSGCGEVNKNIDRVTNKIGFIRASRKKWGFKYDYTDSKYTGYDKKISIRCPEHNHTWEMTAYAHYNKDHSGCDYCPGPTGKVKKMTKGRATEYIRALYGDKFNCDQMEFETVNDKVTVICTWHNEPIIRRLRDLYYEDNNIGCDKCASDSKSKAAQGGRIGLIEYAPHVVAQWHPIKNGNKKPENYSRGSNEVIYWLCNICGEDWRAMINTRVGANKGCPACDGKKITHANSLGGNNPDAIKLWNYEKNIKTPYEYAPNTKERLYFICDKEKCNHYHFIMTALKFNQRGQRCPACAGKTPIAGKSLMDKLPGIKEYWSPNNKYTGYDLMPYSHKDILLQCKDFKHEWQTKPTNISSGGINCPKCNPFAGYSRIAIEWLDNVAKKENIIIQHGNNLGEYKLPILNTHVDGYCKETNTVYEFHGTFWHGHPTYYNSEDINKITRKTYGELYAQTLRREQKIREAGYNLIVMWEHDYKNIKPRIN